MNERTSHCKDNNQEDIEFSGYKWKVDLYHEEDKLKNKYQQTLWLT